MHSTYANGSIAHTTGNITYILTEYLKGLFPAHFFHHVHLTSRVAYREFLVDDNRENNQFIKKNRPILVVRPQVDIGNDDIFMSGSRHTATYMGEGYIRERGGYLPLFRDNENDVSLNYLVNRLRVVLDCTIMLDTVYQQTNVYALLLNMFHDSQIYWLKAATECYIPKGLLEFVSDLGKVPMYDKDTGSVRKFLEYLTQHSNKYFTYKAKTASQTDEFFVYYPMTLEMVFTSFSKNDMNKHNDVTHSADITFQLIGEFNTIGMYELTTERDDLREKANMIVSIDTAEGIQIIPYFTVQNIFGPENKDGWQLFYSNMFMVDPDIPRGEPDIIDLKKEFANTAFSDIIKYHKEHGISNDVFCSITIMKNNEMLNCDSSKGKVSYVIDWDKEQILLYNKSYQSTYRLIIYVNNLYVNTLSNRINDLEGSYEKDIHADRR